MRPLLTLSARYSLLACAVVAALGVAAGTIRLLPWFVAREVPLRLALPFAELLGARTLEVSILVGVPTGVGIAAALFVERGEARALGALGVRPLRLVLGLVVPGLLCVAAVAALQARTDSEPPGRFAARLIDAGRASCPGNTRGRVDVPLLSLSWLCFENAPRLVGAVPGLGRGVWFTARGLSLTDELHSLNLVEPHLAAAIPEGLLTVSAAHARVVGLPAWGSPRGVAGALRGAVVGASALGAALGSAWAILAAGLGRPVAGAALSGVIALATLSGLRGFDARQAAGWSYFTLAPAGLLFGAIAFGLLSLVAVRSHIAGPGAR